MSQPEDGLPQTAVEPTSTAAPELQRVTTRFYVVQDRIGISGDLPQGPIMLWLTQRMLRRLLPVLVGWLAKHDPSKDLVLPASDLYLDVLQGFAQHAARKQSEQMRVVPAVGADVASPQHLVSSVKVEHTVQCLRIVFSSEQAPVAQMVLFPQLLRQWLNILFDVYCSADWPLDLWPAWMRDEEALSVNTLSVQVH